MPLVRVEDCAALVLPTAVAGKACKAGAMVTVPPVAVPVSVMLWVAGLALSELSSSVSVPVSAPESVGLKSTGSVQLLPEASEVNGKQVEEASISQEEVIAPLPEEPVSGSLPMLFRMAVCGSSTASGVPTGVVCG